MIITSLLDTDLYKFTMMQAVLHQFPSAQVSYKFKCRNPGVQLECIGQPVTKLSDTPSKNMCEDQKYLAYLRQVFDIEAPG